MRELTSESGIPGGDTMDLPPDVANMASGLQEFHAAPAAPASSDAVATASPEPFVDAEVVEAETPATEGGLKPVLTFICVFLLTFTSMIVALRLGGWPPDTSAAAPSKFSSPEEHPAAIDLDGEE